MGIEDYHVIHLVGEGSFGKVYKGRRKYTRQVLVLLPAASGSTGFMDINFIYFMIHSFRRSP
jgi:serine/threonine protein kinase